MPFIFLVLATASVWGGSSALDDLGCSSGSDETQLLSRSIRSRSSTEQMGTTNIQRSNTSSLLTSMRDLAHKVGKGEATVDNATKVILDEIDTQMDNILTSTMAAHTEDQENVNAFRDNIAACGAKAETDHTKPDGINELKSNMDQKEVTHNTCRIDEKVKLQDATAKCNAFQDYAQALSPPSCMLSFPSGPSTASWECIEKNKIWSDAVHTEYPEKKQACDDASALIASSQSTCNNDQGTFESAVCSHAQELTRACSDQEGCRATASEARTKAHSRIATAEASRKIEFKSVKKIKCYLNVLRASDATQSSMYAACDSLAPDATGLDLVYPPVPDPAACDVSPAAQKPCDQAWVGSKYGDQTDWYDFTEQNRYTARTYADKVLPVACTPCASSAQASSAGVPSSAGVTGGLQVWWADQVDGSKWVNKVTPGTYDLELTGSPTHDGTSMAFKTSDHGQTVFQTSYPGQGQSTCAGDMGLGGATGREDLTMDYWLYLTDKNKGRIWPVNADRSNWARSLMINECGGGGSVGIGGGGCRDSGTDIEANTWYHFAVTWDGDVHTRKLYMNGNLLYTNTDNSNQHTDCTLFVNNAPTGTWNKMPDGSKVANIRIYNRVLDLSEVQTNFAAGRESVSQSSTVVSAAAPQEPAPQAIRSCMELVAAGQAESKVYEFTDGTSHFCDMSTDGGGWTLIARVNTDHDWIDETTSPYLLNLWVPAHQRTTVDIAPQPGSDSGISTDPALVREYKGAGAWDLRFSFYDNDDATTPPAKDGIVTLSAAKGSDMFSDRGSPGVTFAKGSGDYTFRVIAGTESQFRGERLCWAGSSSFGGRGYEPGLFFGTGSNCHLSNDASQTMMKSHYGGGCSWDSCSSRHTGHDDQYGFFGGAGSTSTKKLAVWIRRH